MSIDDGQVSLVSQFTIYTDGGWQFANFVAAAVASTVVRHYFNSDPT